MKHHVVSTQVENASEQDQTRFLFNTLGMWLLSRRVVPALRTVSGFTWDVAPLPVGKQQAGILHTDAYCISKASKNKDLAWKFVEYANGPVGQVIAAKTGRTVPSLKSVAALAHLSGVGQAPGEQPGLPRRGAVPARHAADRHLAGYRTAGQCRHRAGFLWPITVDEAIKEIEEGTAADFKRRALPQQHYHSHAGPGPARGR